MQEEQKKDNGCTKRLWKIDRGVTLCTSIVVSAVLLCAGVKLLWPEILVLCIIPPINLLERWTRTYWFAMGLLSGILIADGIFRLTMVVQH